MRTENLINGGCTIDEQEMEQLLPINHKLYELIDELINKMMEMRKDNGLSPEINKAIVMHDAEWTVKELACDVECEGILDEYAADEDCKRYDEVMDYYNQLNDSHETWSKKVFKEE